MHGNSPWLRLAKIENKAGTDIRSSYTYNEVNAIGQRKKVTAAYNLGSGITHNAGETNWSYDDGFGHLTKADAPGTIADRAFEYDHIGNRQKSADSLTLPGSNNYVSNSLNQYTAVDSFSPGYDDDGNQTTAQIKPITSTTPMSSLFAWDGSNQLAEVKDDATTSRVKYRYDALNRRIARVLPDGNITHFIYDGWNCIAEYSASSSAAASLARKRTWGLDLSGQQQGAGGVGGLLSETQGGTPYYPTYDGNGNISEYLNADGSAAAHFEYDAFGRTILPTAANDSNQFTYRFSTKPIEPLTGLYYYGYRWYDPMTGRWPSRDPIEEEGGLNLYGFVGNDGVGMWDVLGNFALSAVVKNKSFKCDNDSQIVIKWKVNGTKKGGVIRQLMTVSYHAESCIYNNGISIDENLEYTEFWSVGSQGQVSNGGKDEWVVPMAKCTKGSAKFVGTAFFEEGGKVPPNAKIGLPGSGGLPGVPGPPKFSPIPVTSMSNMYSRMLVASWNCCDGKLDYKYQEL